MAFIATRQAALLIALLYVSTFGSAQITVGNGFIDLNFSAEPHFEPYDRWSFGTPSLVNLWEAPVTFADVDGDGFVDVVFSLYISAHITWRGGATSGAPATSKLPGAAGTLNEEVGERILIVLPETQLYRSVNVIAAGDFNADSREDLLVVNGHVQWYAREAAATADGVGNVANFSAEGIPAVFVGYRNVERIYILPDVRYQCRQVVCGTSNTVSSTNVTVRCYALVSKFMG